MKIPKLGWFIPILGLFLLLNACITPPIPQTIEERIEAADLTVSKAKETVAMLLSTNQITLLQAEDLKDELDGMHKTIDAARQYVKAGVQIPQTQAEQLELALKALDKIVAKLAEKEAQKK
jgi:hypothetical protein